MGTELASKTTYYCDRCGDEKEPRKFKDPVVSSLHVDDVGIGDRWKEMSNDHDAHIVLKVSMEVCGWWPDLCDTCYWYVFQQLYQRWQEERDNSEKTLDKIERTV